MSRTTNRIFLVLLVASAGVWLFAFIQGRIEQAEDRRFYAEHVAPWLNEQKSQSEAPRRALEDHTPLPSREKPPTDPLPEWIGRISRRGDRDGLRLLAGIAFQCSLYGWSVALLIQRERAARAWSAPDRPAHPHAGMHLTALRNAGGILVAKSRSRRVLVPRRTQEVVIDANEGTVVFRGFTFVTGFTGNRRTESTTLGLADILGVRDYLAGGRNSIHVRTTRGKVVINDSIHPLNEVAEVLFDAAEVNRLSPDTYRAALSREPVVRTPRYVWIIIAGVLAAFIAAGFAL